MVREATANAAKVAAGRRAEALAAYFERIERIARKEVHPEWTAVRIPAVNGTLFWGQTQGYSRAVDCAGNLYRATGVAFRDVYKPGGEIEFGSLTPIV